MFVRPNSICFLDDETSGQGSGAPSPSPGHSPAKEKSPSAAVSKWNQPIDQSFQSDIDG